MTNTEFANKAIDIAKNYKTLYVMGGIGFPMTSSRKSQCMNQYSYNAKRKNIITAASADTFGFDCVGIIKSILWGWNGDTSHALGGAKYASNGVPDINEDTMIARCSDISTDFTNIMVGEVVWMSGHIGIYIGDGLAVEATPAWSNKVQITSCNCAKSGYNRRNWTKHGKLPYVAYTNANSTKTQPKVEPKKEPSKVDYLAIIKKYEPKGYLYDGDKNELVGKIAEFMYKMFPAYTNKAALGDLYGPNIKKSILEFQKRVKMDKRDCDGYVGPKTLEKLYEYGFKI